MSIDITILLTSAQENSEDFLDWTNEEDIEIVHLPLEKYISIETDLDDLEEQLESAENVIYGHKRNAQFFVEQVKERDLLEVVRNRINLAGHQRAAEYLEEEGIPAIYPGSDEPIKMLEFLMRLRRLGTVFYPCGTHKNEEIPGLLTEMDIEVNERAFYELEGPSEEELSSYQKRVSENNFDGIVYHSRRAVNRIQAAFPNVYDTTSYIIAGDQAVADKLSEDHDIEADLVAEGSWRSIFKQIKELKQG